MFIIVFIIVFKILVVGCGVLLMQQVLLLHLIVVCEIYILYLRRVYVRGHYPKLYIFAYIQQPINL